MSLGAKRDEQLGRNQAIVGFSMPLPVFDRNQDGLRAALARSGKVADELQAANIKLQNDVNTAYRRFDLARREITTQQRELLDSAQQALDVTTKGFSLGKFGLLEVLDAQRTLLQARSQYLRALSEAYRAAGDIQRMLGDATPLQE